MNIIMSGVSRKVSAPAHRRRVVRKCVCFGDWGCLVTTSDFWLKWIYSWYFYGVGKLLDLSLCVLWRQPNLPGQGEPASSAQPWITASTFHGFYGLAVALSWDWSLAPKGVKLRALKSFDFSWVWCLTAQS